MSQGSVRRVLLGGGFVASLALAGAALVFGPGFGHKAQSNTPAAMPPMPVSVASVEQRDLIDWSEFSGRLEAIERVDVRSRVAGVIEKVHFREGSLVAQGDLLVSIDAAPYRAEVERAEAQVVAAEARTALALSEHERGQRLMSSQNLSQRDLDTRFNALREAQANQRAAQAALQTARLNLDYTQIRAPIAGRIGRMEVTSGNLVGQGAAAPLLATIMSVSPIYASFNADERTVLRALASVSGEEGGRRALERIPVRMGTVTSEGTPLGGHLRFVDNGVDPASGTVRVRAVFDNADGGLMPGQFVRLRLGQARSAPALVVSERAVGTDQNKKFVFVVGADNKAVYREVTLGAIHDGLRIVANGLTAGERIVVNGLQRVRPGATVAPEAVPMADRAEIRPVANAATGETASR
jgi:multidrug efflux system membrane fusion protein